jgi:uncharacterized YccA/Bax inhibitor family protein
MGSGWSIRPQSGKTGLTRAPRVFYAVLAGMVLDAITVIVCALNVVSAQQAVAMALPAGLLTAGGMIGLLLPDPWVAWRRGFQQGCVAAARSDSSPMAVNGTTKSARNVRLSA